MTIHMSRRTFGKVLAGGAVATAAAELSRTAAFAAPSSGYRAMVGLFLLGGNDGWNMIVPNDARYGTYAKVRNPAIVLPTSSLLPLAGSAYSINSALAPLQSIWDEGALNFVLNTGTLYRPITRQQFQNNPELRPVNLMSHSDEQAHWQGLRARENSGDGFMGRISDRTAQGTLPSNISFGGANLISLGQNSQPLVLPAGGFINQEGVSTNTADPVAFARNNAASVLNDTTGLGTVTATTGSGLATAYSQNATANGILSSSASIVAQYFVNPATGQALNSDLAQQLLRVARMIEGRNTLGQQRQTFFVSHAGYDTHTSQLYAHRNLYTDLGLAVAAFYRAMKGLGLAENVTLFTMSDFGRVLKGNASGGADHAWGNNHFVVGGGLNPKGIYGTYPQLVLGGPDDSCADGRFIPTTASEEYLGAIAKWHGVSSGDMSYVFPNWATWSSNGRGPVPMFRS